MICEIGSCLVEGREMRICLGYSENGDPGADNLIILGKDDICPEWMEDIKKDNDGAAFYFFLFFLLSIRKRLYIDDRERLVKMDPLKPDILPDTGEYGKRLFDHVKERGYKLALFKGHRELYRQQSYLLNNTGAGSLFLSDIKTAAFFYKEKLSELTAFAGIDTENRLKGRYLIKKIKAHFKDCSVIKPADSRTHSIFLKCMEEDGRLLFVKGNAAKSGSIINELKAAAYLRRHSKNVSLYLLPERAFFEKRFAVYPYCEGESLKKVMEERSLFAEELRRLSLFIADVVEDLSAAGLVHCDIQPDNILLMDDGEGNTCFKLSDFGCASLKGKKLPVSVYAPAEIFYSGKEYRFADNGWDDSVSSFYMLKDVIRKCGESESGEIAESLNRIKRLRGSCTCFYEVLNNG
ncbi:MAG: protein kinase [Lachnospiraceae bacterium]|nr:protein kinase [Lachnospiraceae bacterium]